MTRWFNGQMQYTLSRADNDTNGIASFPANDYDLSGEWARADFDRRHRFLLLGRVSARSVVDLGVGADAEFRRALHETLGGDLFNNGRGRARPPGVPRNSLEGDGFASLDLRASRDREARTRGRGRARIDARRSTPSTCSIASTTASYVGTLGSPLFGAAGLGRDRRGSCSSRRAVKF